MREYKGKWHEPRVDFIQDAVLETPKEYYPRLAPKFYDGSSPATMPDLEMDLFLHDLEVIKDHELMRLYGNMEPTLLWEIYRCGRSDGSYILDAAMRL